MGTAIFQPSTHTKRSKQDFSKIFKNQTSKFSILLFLKIQQKLKGKPEGINLLDTRILLTFSEFANKI